MAPRPVTLAAALLAALVLTTPASAKIVEVGRTDATPACPASPCLAVSRTTGYQIKVADERNTFVVPEDGKIVAWSIALGKPTAEQTAFFDKSLGGPASARLSVIRLGKQLFSRTVTQSPIQLVQPYFGQTVLESGLHCEVVHRLVRVVMHHRAGDLRLEDVARAHGRTGEVVPREKLFCDGLWHGFIFPAPRRAGRWLG